MIIAIVVMLGVVLLSAFIASSVVPDDFEGLGLEVIGSLISFGVFLIVFFKIIKLSIFFGIKDDEEESIPFKVWGLLSFVVAMSCSYISFLILF